MDEREEVVEVTMEPYLVGCEVLSMSLRIPRSHISDLLGYFDGQGRNERGSARAHIVGRELYFESCGGRLALLLENDVFVVSDLEIFDDRSGDFFEKVVLNLFVFYGGNLRCITEWSPSRVANERCREITVQKGCCSWKMSRISETGGWLNFSSKYRNEDSEPSECLVEEILAKLDEAERCYAEYVRLRDQGERRKPGGQR